MKRPGLTPRLLAATLFLVTAPLWPVAAQEMMANTPAAKAAKKADELLKRFDKNQDGKLDDDERADAKEEMMKEQIDRQMARSAALPGGLEQFRAQALAIFDKNRDGRLDEDERTVAQKFADEHRSLVGTLEELTKRFDQNGDGSLDADERKTQETFLAELRGLGATKMRSELLQRFDRNTNGKVDDAESAELEKFVRPRIETTPRQLQRHDTNRDGKLDDAEWTKARGTILQWLNGQGPAALENGMLQSDFAPSPEYEQARLNAVAAEVARRRAQREQATEVGKKVPAAIK